MIAIAVTVVAAFAAVLGFAVWQYPPRGRELRGGLPPATARQLRHRYREQRADLRRALGR